MSELPIHVDEAVRHNLGPSRHQAGWSLQTWRCCESWCLHGISNRATRLLRSSEWPQIDQPTKDPHRSMNVILDDAVPYLQNRESNRMIYEIDTLALQSMRSLQFVHGGMRPQWLV